MRKTGTACTTSILAYYNIMSVLMCSLGTIQVNKGLHPGDWGSGLLRGAVELCVGYINLDSGP